MTRKQVQQANDSRRNSKRSAGKYEPEQRLHVQEQAKKFQLADQIQRMAVRSIKENYLTILCGAAGTSKTLLSCYGAYQLLKSPESEIKKIVLARLSAESFGENIGSLPGQLDEKLMHLLMPIIDNLQHFMTEGEIKMLIDKQQIEVVPISYLRGRSFYKSVIIIEEAQNLSREMILTCLTRLGQDSCMIINGDPAQTDFYGRNGIKDAIEMTEGLDGVDIFEFDSSYIRRHPLVKAIIEREEEKIQFQN